MDGHSAIRKKWISPLYGLRVWADFMSLCVGNSGGLCDHVMNYSGSAEGGGIYDQISDN